MAARVGLTGGIGSGKSTVGDLLRKREVLVIDADQVARLVTEPGTAGLAAITDRLGAEVLNEDGTLDRKSLGNRVFTNPSLREWLESLLHPVIREKMDQQAAHSDRPWCVLEVPLLVESGRYRDMWRTVVVDCPAPLRSRRLQAARGMSAEQIARIMASQASDAERLEIADYVIDNRGDEHALLPQVDQLVAALDKAIG